MRDIDTTSDNKTGWANTGGGAAIGAIAGAMLLGPLGLAIGAILGAAVGGIATSITGAGSKEESEALD